MTKLLEDTAHYTEMLWRGEWRLGSGIFHQFSCSCTWLVLHLLTCSLSKQVIFCGIWIYLHPKALIYNSHSQSHPHQAKPKLFQGFLQMEVSKMYWALFMSYCKHRATLNTSMKGRWEEEDGSAWLRRKIWAGWQDLYLMVTLSLPQIPLNIWMLFFQLSSSQVCNMTLAAWKMALFFIRLLPSSNKDELQLKCEWKFLKWLQKMASVWYCGSTNSCQDWSGG